MVKKRKEYFYDVFMEETDQDTDKILFQERIATFKTLKDADDFITNHITDNYDICSNVVKIYKLSYGAHYTKAVETHVYKFDRKI